MQKCRRDKVQSELANLARGDRRHSTLAEQIIVLDADGKLELCGCHTHGHCNSPASVFCPLARPNDGQHVIAAVLRGELSEGQFEYTTADGKGIRLASVVARGNGGVTISHCDITTRVRVEDRQRVAATLFDSSKDMHAAVDPAGTVLLANVAAERSLGRTSDSLLGTHLSELVDARFLQQNGEEIAALLRSDGYWAGEALLQTRTGTLSVWGSVRVVGGDAQQAARFLVSACDLRGNEHGKASLAAMALLDPLTGLRNRRALLEHLRFALLRAKRHGTQLGLLYLDLDGFKEINDSLGHEAGDEVLRQVAARLQGVMRATDLCARLGGDEFTVVIEDIHKAPALSLVRSKVERALSAPIVVQGRPLRIGASIGSSSSRQIDLSAEQLLDAGDKAMYREKLRRKKERTEQSHDEQA